MKQTTFTQLTKAQAELNNHIALEKAIDLRDYKIHRIIALQVEFGELLNELPFLFKYWKSKPMDFKKALEEYVDGIHFLLSIANDLGITEYEYQKPKEYDMKELVLGIGNMISILPQTENFTELMNHYWQLGEKLGFTEEMIIEAYQEKNAENHARQERGY
jgi:dimeric dUTPase (all-alpha-NTP-PPase superfamily)